MARGYSRDLRERVLQAMTSGLAASEVVRTMGVSRSSLTRWKRKERAGVSLEPGHGPGPAHRIGADAAAALRTQVGDHADATLAEHCALWTETHPGTSISRATMSRTLQRLGLALKKRL